MFRHGPIITIQILITVRRAKDMGQQVRLVAPVTDRRVCVSVDLRQPLANGQCHLWDALAQAGMNNLHCRNDQFCRIIRRNMQMGHFWMML